jgi:hypothetical protein
VHDVPSESGATKVRPLAGAFAPVRAAAAADASDVVDALNVAVVAERLDVHPATASTETALSQCGWRRRW